MPLNLSIPGPRKFLHYVWDLRAFVITAIVIFMAFYLLGYLAAVAWPGLSDSLMSGLKDEVSPMKELSPIGLMLGIFENNAIKCFMVLVLGLAFGIVPMLFTLANGLILGIVSGMTAAKYGALFVAVGVVPHGVVELPMVLLSAAIGLKLGMDMALEMLSRMALIKRKVNLFDEVKQALLIYFCWVFPLLFLAAFLETFITGPLLYYLFMAR